MLGALPFDGEKAKWGGLLWWSCKVDAVGGKVTMSAQTVHETVYREIERGLVYAPTSETVDVIQLAESLGWEREKTAEAEEEPEEEEQEEQEEVEASHLSRRRNQLEMNSQRTAVKYDTIATRIVV